MCLTVCEVQTSLKSENSSVILPSLSPCLLSRELAFCSSFYVNMRKKERKEIKCGELLQWDSPAAGQTAIVMKQLCGWDSEPLRQSDLKMLEETSNEFQWNLCEREDSLTCLRSSFVITQMSNKQEGIRLCRSVPHDRSSHLSTPAYCYSSASLLRFSIFLFIVVDLKEKKHTFF